MPAFTKKGLDAYECLIAELLRPIAKRAIDPELKGTITDFEMKTYRTLSHNATEIREALDAATLATRFLQLRKPAALSDVSDDQYLRYHVAAFLEEIYILQERLETFCARVSRLYSKSNGGDRIGKSLAAHTKSAISALKSATGARHGHVHTARLTDEGFEDLKVLAAAAQFDRGSIAGAEVHFLAAAKSKYREEKRRWTKMLIEAEVQCRKLVDDYFDDVCALIAPEGKLMLPDARYRR